MWSNRASFDREVVEFLHDYQSYSSRHGTYGPVHISHCTSVQEAVKAHQEKNQIKIQEISFEGFSILILKINEGLVSKNEIDYLSSIHIKASCQLA